MLKSIHRFLFTGVLPQLMTAGEYRTYDISKSEPVLNGESVAYTSSFMLFDTLEYDFSEEAKKTYKTMDDMEKVLAVKKFISGIWQIHPFEEGNTRTIAVFTELYLRSLGFQVDKQPFADNAQYFRDALVLDNTTNLAFKNGKPLEDVFLQLTRQEDKQIFNSLRKT
jgi:fido (protein-threonine AMPylation protein)